MIEKLKLQFDSIRNEVAAGQLAAVITRYSDLVLVMAIACMVGMMIVPLPTFILDVLLTVNITAAVTLLMVSIYIADATQIASYPTLLLITTLYRLSLDISATRLILLQADAGEVIYSFGNFVVQGNFVVGAVIFLIITLVQFIVITKGAERVAEVAARFTLDAMPGKQMSIDADLRAGILDFKQARTRREALARESQFYGAMDGAMKFVKGDAIAGIVITVINIVGGLVIGVAMNGMPALEALETYSILTIGNGLVSQIPALLIAISAGMVVTRVAADTPETNLGKEIGGQILAQPKAISITAALLFLLALTPGLPKIPFFLLAGLAGAVGYGLYRGKNNEATEAEAKKPELESRAPDFSPTTPIMLVVSEDLASFIDPATPSGKAFSDTLRELRHTLYYETGVPYPPIKVFSRPMSSPGAYHVLLNEIPAATGQLRADLVLVGAAQRDVAIYGLKGEETRNPATGRPAIWLSRNLIDRVKSLQLALWEPHEVLLLHLGHFMRSNAQEFVGVQETQWLVSQLKQIFPSLVDEVAPKPISYQVLTEVLRRLVEEHVSIRDLKSVLQSLSEVGRSITDPVELVEHVRSGMKRTISFKASEGKTTLFVYRLDAEFEDMFRNSIRYGPAGQQIQMESSMIQQIRASVQGVIGNLPATAQRPVILTDKDIRPFVFRLLQSHFPDLTVLSFDQISPQIRPQHLAFIDAAAATKKVTR